MDIKFYISIARFWSLSALYLFVVFSSIYGFFIDEIYFFGFTLTGWSKNLLCLFGLFILGIISLYPILIGIYRAVDNGNSK